jgi:hypothetical protein
VKGLTKEAAWAEVREEDATRAKRLRELEV